MDANLYVDGFNLFYRALRHTPWRWLDLQALSHSLLPQCQLPITLLDSHGTITRPSAWQTSDER
ncbi:MAG: hypothetical protein OXG43_12755 [Chloroflexi bacterium]|nr:hypothetical protein [Chloroflexota bacterium]